MTPCFLCSCEAEYNLSLQHPLKQRVLRCSGENAPSSPLINSTLSASLSSPCDALSSYSVVLVLSVCPHFFFSSSSLVSVSLSNPLKFSVFLQKSSEAAPPSTSPSSLADRSRQEVQVFPVFCNVVLFCCVLLPCCLVDMLCCCRCFVGPSERSEQSTSQ